jgi:hypothetical protein
VSKITLELNAEDHSSPLLKVVGEPLVIGKGISDRHPIFSVEFAPEVGRFRCNMSATKWADFLRLGHRRTYNPSICFTA